MTWLCVSIAPGGMMAATAAADAREANAIAAADPATKVPNARRVMDICRFSQKSVRFGR